jgi:hypothetical protein
LVDGAYQTGVRLSEQIIHRFIPENVYIPNDESACREIVSPLYGSMSLGSCAIGTFALREGMCETKPAGWRLI